MLKVYLVNGKTAIFEELTLNKFNQIMESEFNMICNDKVAVMTDKIVCVEEIEEVEE